MRKIKQLFLGLVVLISGTACFAKQLSVQIVQHDGTQEKIINQSYVIEDELLNGFFDKGFIVTTSPAATSDSTNQDEILVKTGLLDAKDGQSDYFIQVRLYFLQDKSGADKYDGLIRMDWSIYSVATGKLVKESSFNQLKKLRIEKDLKTVSNDLLAELYKVVK
ncbi:MAG: hypothetical protein MJ174_01075 [Treponema sp.]|nr:hypothetical protein [Treponema sp.]